VFIPKSIGEGKANPVGNKMVFEDMIFFTYQWGMWEMVQLPPNNTAIG